MLYYDTDSVIYKWSVCLLYVSTGDYLGDLKDELGGDHIVECVSGGPKNYAYRTAEKKKFDRVLQRSERQFDRIKQKYDKRYRLVFDKRVVIRSTKRPLSP